MPPVPPKPAIRFRPLDAPPPAAPGARTGIRMPGKLSYPDIVKRFETELAELAAQNVVIESGHDASDLRLDGHLQNNAKPPRFPALAVRLYAGVTLGGESPIGALRIATGTYDDWQGNLWAVAMTLERLRTLASYGTAPVRDLYALFADDSPDAAPPTPSPTGEKKRPRPQKTKPRPAPTPVSGAPLWDAAKTDAAKRLLREAGEDDHFRFAVLLLKNASTARRVFIAATKNAHPDGGGSDERMRGVSEAWDVLSQ